jgi:hypothetical protein
MKQINFSEEEEEIIKEWSDKFQMTETAIIRRAVRLLGCIETHQQAGGEMQFIEKDGSIFKLRLI